MNDERLLIIIPTYNEAKNIKKLIETIFLEISQLSNNRYEFYNQFHILVVDDNSPDKTSSIVSEIKKKYNNLHLLKRKGKYGLGTAYIEGFRWGLKNGFSYFLEMDADFSHDPSYIKNFLKYIPEYDAVIGSRYIKGGKVKNWGLFRKLISKGGSLYARSVLNVNIKDFTGGFNLWKKEVIVNIDFENIISEGYSFQIELKYRAYKKGYKIVEFPIIFVDRTSGKSKMSKKIVFEALINVIKFRFRKY